MKTQQMLDKTTDKHNAAQDNERTQRRTKTVKIKKKTKK
jgi:hypothetical protein